MSSETTKFWQQENNLSFVDTTVKLLEGLKQDLTGNQEASMHFQTLKRMSALFQWQQNHFFGDKTIEAPSYTVFQDFITEGINTQEALLYLSDKKLIDEKSQVWLTNSLVPHFLQLSEDNPRLEKLLFGGLNEINQVDFILLAGFVEKGLTFEIPREFVKTFLALDPYFANKSVQLKNKVQADWMCFLSAGLNLEGVAESQKSEKASRVLGKIKILLDGCFDSLLLPDGTPEHTHAWNLFDAAHSSEVVDIRSIASLLCLRAVTRDLTDPELGTDISKIFKNLETKISRHDDPGKYLFLLQRLVEKFTVTTPKYQRLLLTSQLRNQTVALESNDRETVGQRQQFDRYFSNLDFETKQGFVSIPIAPDQDIVFSFNRKGKVDEIRLEINTGENTTVFIDFETSKNGRFKLEALVFDYKENGDQIGFSRNRDLGGLTQQIEQLVWNKVVELQPKQEITEKPVNIDQGSSENNTPNFELTPIEIKFVQQQLDSYSKMLLEIGGKIQEFDLEVFKQSLQENTYVGPKGETLYENEKGQWFVGHLVLQNRDGEKYLVFRVTQISHKVKRIGRFIEYLQREIVRDYPKIWRG